MNSLQREAQELFDDAYKQNFILSETGKALLELVGKEEA